VAGICVFLYASFHYDELTFESVRYWITISLVIALTLILANFEWTLRSGEQQQRWRIKFLIVGIASVFLFMIFNFSYLLLFPAADFDFSGVLPTVILAGVFRRLLPPQPLDVVPFPDVVSNRLSSW
jgi:drug/metabolite transporter (DMT)-like permease